MLVYFQINDLLLLLLIQKEFSPNLGSLRKLCQIMDLNILDKITNCLQNNGTSNMTHYPKSNEQVEQTIQTIARLPSMNTNIAIKNKIYRKSNSDEYNYTNLPHLKKNDNVRLNDRQTWKIKGEVVEHFNEPPRSNLIRTENGNILCCNRKHILLSKGGNSDSYFKNETNDEVYLFNIYDKTNKTTNQTPDNLCNKVEKATYVMQTCSGRFVKRPSRYDDYVMK